MWSKTTKSPESSPETLQILREMKELLGKKEPEIDQRKVLSNEMRIDALEIKFESLRKECLRYLRQGSTRHQKAEELLDDGELETHPDVSNLPAIAPQPEQNGAGPNGSESDLDYVNRIIREQGTPPILG